jgi:hypothetical protein
MESNTVITMSQLLRLPLSVRVCLIERIMLNNLIQNSQHVEMAEIKELIANQSSPFVGEQKAIPGIIYRTKQEK